MDFLVTRLDIAVFLRYISALLRYCNIQYYKNSVEGANACRLPLKKDGREWGWRA
jgi:hypothetical protein